MGTCKDVSSLHLQLWATVVQSLFIICFLLLYTTYFEVCGKSRPSYKVSGDLLIFLVCEVSQRLFSLLWYRNRKFNFALNRTGTNKSQQCYKPRKYLYALQHGRKMEYNKSLTGGKEEKGENKQVYLITLRKPQRVLWGNGLLQTFTVILFAQNYEIWALFKQWPQNQIWTIAFSGEKWLIGQCVLL